MDPLGVLANEYVRRLSNAQYGGKETPTPGRDAAPPSTGADTPRWRRATAAFRRVATALLG